MKRKREGNSLIVVVIISMFLSIVSMAMLSMVASNYKARVVESKRIENLYASDSGLDVAYNIIGKTFDAAAKYANLKVTQLENTISTSNDTSIYNKDYTNINDDIDALNRDIEELLNWNANHEEDEQRPPSDIDKDIAQKKALIKEDENMKDIICNEEFKRAFKNFIKKHEYKVEGKKYDEDEDDDQNRLGTNESAPNQLKDLIETHKYISEVTNINTYAKQTIEFGIKNKNNNPPNLEATVTENTVVSSYESKGISKSNGHYYDVSFTIYDNQFYDISIKSMFSTERITENRIDKEVNQRQLQANYKILVPNYKDIYFENSDGNLNEYLGTKDRAITVYGDMNVNNVSGLTVDGEIFVQGSNDNSDNDRVYGKYFGGIAVKNSDKVLLKKNVVTRGTFNIENTTTTNDPRTVTMSEDLYARNVYIGKIENDSNELANGKSLLDASKGKVVLDNDLTLNANNTNIEIQDFYGINDNKINKVKSSSSIIVNGNNNSQININNSAYIMGTAHIATDGDYQTAESGAVKGNYIAYSIQLTDAEKDKYDISKDPSEQFKYDAPLQLLDPNPDLYPEAITDQDAKEKHFIAYWNEDGRSPSPGGIHWPSNVYSAGVIISETNEDIEVNGKSQKKSVVIPSTYMGDVEISGSVYEERMKFAKYVYKFGQSADIDDYYKNIVTDFGSLIDTSKIPSKYNLTEQENNGEYAIFSNGTFIENRKEKYKEIQITKADGNKDIIDNTDSKVIKIEVGSDENNKYTLDAVIATAGKVSIESDDITINGCIIAEGDLDINGDNITINYVPEVIERVQANNSDTFNAVFGESILTDTDNESNSTQKTTEISNSNYDLKNFLENKLWKILK